MKINWDATGERYYEAGVDHGVLYRKGEDGKNYSKGVPWNGLINVSENPEGAEVTKLWADNMHYASMMSAETYGGGIECYTYPPEFHECEGLAEVAPGAYIGQQKREPFGLCYRSLIGDDTTTDPNAYKLHMVYNATVSPTEKTHETVNESPDAETFSYEFDTTPVSVTGYKPTAKFEIDSRHLDAVKLKAIEDILYGTEAEEPRLPWPDELITLLKATA